MRKDDQGGIVKLKDVARTEIGEQNYTFNGMFNNQTAVMLAINQKPGCGTLPRS